MKVILTEKVKTLGNVGEIVNVSEGYARNFLIPQQYAILADARNTKEVELAQKRLAKKVEEEKQAALNTKKTIEGITINLIKRVGSDGKLFGSVTNTELAKVLEKEHGLEIERRTIVIDTPIKACGNFETKVKLFVGVDAVLKVAVQMDEKQKEEMKLLQAQASKKKAQAKAEAEEKKEEETTEEAQA